MHTATANAPDIITKELQIARVAGRRKIRLSSNWLPLIGFEAGVRHDVSPIGVHEGLRLTFSAEGRQKVYQRRYARRRSNPFETVVEIGSQSVLDQGIPGYAERLHFTLRHGEIVIRPLPNHTFAIRHRLRAENNPFAAMVAMTSGIDVRCLMDSGFHIDSVLEYRPHEARDKYDLTETGALNVLANARPRVLINEDISRVDWDTVRTLMDGGPQIAVMHVSLQCDDFSTVKGANIRRQAVDDLTTSRDLAYDALRMVETIRPACIVLENVPGFATSAEGQLFKIKLRRWGYEVSDAVLNAGQLGGLTRRERYYLVASVFPGFAMPEPGSIREESIWHELEPFLGGCRDVSHTKSLRDGLMSGRARLITRESRISPTLLKSQARQAKDSIYIDAGDGRYLLPSIDLQRHLNGIPVDLDLSSTSAELASEIIGQSIDYPMHEKVVRALHAHIAANVGSHTAVTLTPKPLTPSVLVPQANYAQ
ncbi:DNA cytosine methyltransferase [Cupriavidus sp. TMH.W2]|uniref:DNA cytosine methyltransferase n=1 Tax=Cupriavidus sp. TMH.W2 TaxID=3434465 RepID=UPI003D77B123